ncbi:nudix hydrolase 15, mitochondrial-like isoform X5 [Camellia sinensis]|uniref:nudix hydrolase 15, mitochondrial-like isoform X5 n=1 Tax=Camellia sinensis TaxID=4442 RepID=UPI001035DC2C|nr:nudix hydrolase 15, mitochondrial-like isoform X5 [Camellia sinensis]
MNCFLVAINFWTILFMLRRASSNYLSKSKLIMDSNNCFGGSQRLTTLARHLRLYKPPPTFDESDIEEQRIEESAGKLVSQVGFVESATPIASQPERFKPKRAAVLICLFEGDDGDLRVILTKRSSRLSTHSGEVALPGGKAEEGDKDDAETATREAKEEIGLDPSLVSVVNVLEPFLSKHLLRVIPVICILSDKKAFNPAPNVAEVEAVFDAPLEMFIKDENRMAEEREWMGEKYLIHSFDYETDNNQKYMIWGLTAGILIRAASVVYQRPPAFREQNPKFKIPRIADKHTGLLQVQEACLVVHTPLHYTLSVLFIYTVPMLMNMKGKDELMDSNSIGSAGRLMNIAQQLRLFHTNYNPIEDPTIKDSAGKAVPQDLTTNSESATNPPERIRSKRAAVLICLFEDERGDLRVILTKRSSTLSTNSGWYYCSSSGWHTSRQESIQSNSKHSRSGIYI